MTTKPLSSLALRLISSAILIPLVLGIIIWGGWVFTLLATLCILVAFSEWVHVARHIPISRIAHGSLIILGLLYLVFSLFQIVTLHHLPEGAYWTIVFMAAIWSSDSGAYLFGKTIGGPKMSPTISPNKTWAGYAGALLFPVLILIIASQIAQPDFPPNDSIDGITASVLSACIAGIAIGITGQSGDLMISAMKRKAGLKDTGSLIPGHGGILDRIDALLLALPVYICYLKLSLTLEF